MSEIIWIPGLGNTETFDGALVPPGGHLVSGPSSPVSSSPPPSSPVSSSPPPSQVSVGFTPPIASGGSSSSSPSGSFGGFLSPGIAYDGGYNAPVSIGQQQQQQIQQINAATAAAQAMAARSAQKAANTAWSNDASIRALEEESWDIYVQTGNWSTPQQLALHTQAEQMRKALNPLYPGSGAGGPITQADENKISLPNVAADPTIGKIAPVAAIGIGLLLLLGLVRG